MTHPQTHNRGLGDELTNVLMIGLFVLFGIAAVLHGAGSIAAFLTGVEQPTVGVAGGVNVLFDPAHPAAALGAPRLHTVLYWAVAAFLLGLLATTVVGIWIWLRRHSRAVSTDPASSKGPRAGTMSHPALLRRHSFAVLPHSGHRLRVRSLPTWASCLDARTANRSGPVSKTRFC